jgi:hypothetical protein
VCAEGLDCGGGLAVPNPRKHKSRGKPRLFVVPYLERVKRFERSTPTLARLCSTPELHPLNASPRRWVLTILSAGRGQLASKDGCKNVFEERFSVPFARLHACKSAALPSEIRWMRFGGGSALRRLSVKLCRKPKNTKAAETAAFCVLVKIGAGDGIRTHDPNLGKVVLYP